MTLVPDPLKDPKPLHFNLLTFAEEHNEFPRDPAPCDLSIAPVISIETTVAHKKYRGGGGAYERLQNSAKLHPTPPLYS